MDELGLGLRSPDGSAGARAVPETGTVKSDDAILSRGCFDHAARFEILDHAAVAVQEHDRLTGPRSI